CQSPGLSWRFPVDTRQSLSNTDRGEAYIFVYNLLPCQLEHTARDGCEQYSHPDQCAYSEEHTPPPCPLVKHTQHIVNHLIAPDVNPFLSSFISTVSVLFISTDHCISVIGMSVAVNQFPSSVRMPAAV
ncbi:unnamed protein product, partial [Staurois parvus]